MRNPSAFMGKDEFVVDYEIPPGRGRNRPLLFILNTGRPLLISALRRL
jgi:hypothetical protein